MKNDEERFYLINDIVTGIARRAAYKCEFINAEDLSQTLWLKILEKEQKEQKELNIGLVVKICYDGVIDYQKLEYRRCYNVNIDDVGYDLSDNRSQIERLVIDQNFVDQLLKEFPEGSREHLYFEYWLSSLGLIDKKFEVDDKGYKNGFTYTQLAKILGFPSSQAYAFRVFNKKAQEAFINFLNRFN